MTPTNAALYGFRFDDGNEYPDLFTVLLEARDDGPIISGGRVVFFTRIELATTALAMDDDPQVHSAILPNLSIDETYIFDLAEILATIASLTSDDTSLLLDFLNVLLDLVTASGHTVPAEYRQVLFSFANHVTIEYEFASFLDREGISRDQIRDGIFWCIGAISSRLTILR